MSVWKTINPNDFTTEIIRVHKEFNLDSSSYGQSFIQFKSGSSKDFSSNQSGSHWDSNRVHFYLSGSQTSGLPIGDFVYDIEKYPSGAANVEGAVDKILAGSFLVYPQVTT